MNKEIRDRILEARDEMGMNDFLRFLQVLEEDGKIDIAYEGWDYAMSFATYLVNKMCEDLNSGHWYGYEPKALIALDEIPGGDDILIIVDNYGFPQEIKDNDHFLELVGLVELAGMELEDDED